jgi:Mg2+/Co2+ transporter CorC
LQPIALALDILVGLAAFVVSLLEASALLSDRFDEQTLGGLRFLRLTLIGAFGAIAGQGLLPASTGWFSAALLSLGLMVALLLGSQLLAKLVVRSKGGARLAEILSPVLKSIRLLFTPLALKPVDDTEEFEQELIESVEEFGETITREIMVPRVDMATVDADSSLEAAMAKFLNRGYSRLPVIGKNIDDVRGMLYLKDVARLQNERPADLALLRAEEVARKVAFVPESKPVDDLLKDMQQSRRHVAIVVDEYGGVAGLVTLEDVLEEIVGDIADEHDREIPEFEVIDPTSYRVSARLSLFELGELFELELEDEDVDTVGGLVSKLLGRLPKLQDEVVFSGLQFKVERFDARRKRLLTVLVSRDAELSDVIAAFDDEKEAND